MDWEGDSRREGPPEVFVHGHRLMAKLPGDNADAGGVQLLVTPVLVAHHPCRPAQSHRVSCSCRA